MAEGIESNSPLPPGWESRYDARTKKNYYVDNYNRTTTWEDPRPRYRALLLQSSRQGSPSHSSIGTGEMIPMQHGGLDLRGSSTVYPSYSSYPPPPQPAFQLPATPFCHLAPNSTLYQEFGSARPSPIMGRTILSSPAFQRPQYAETSTTTDELVGKINATFPTVSETHIRLLLKKYHNREAVVMSALQVEKHPVATPGPFSTPPLGRNLHLSGAYTPIQMTPPLSVRGTPSIGVRGSPPTRGSSPGPRPSSAASSYFGSPRFGDYSQSQRTNHSPKMKLRYLKNVFPKAEETLLLDILASEENNVIKATEKLKAMGFDKKDKRDLAHPPPPPSLETRKEEEEKLEIVRPTPSPRMKSLEEKAQMRGRLQGLYEDVPEKLIQIAMESAGFDEEKARQILMIVTDEKENQPITESGTVLGESSADNTDGLNESSKRSSRNLSKKENEPTKKTTAEKPAKSDIPKVSRGTNTEDKDFRSPLLMKTEGRNSALRKGPNDKLLLAEYVTWSGPNSELRSTKTSSLAKGPNKAALGEKRFLAKGANKDLRKGASIGLAKGSIYSQLTEPTESRGQ